MNNVTDENAEVQMGMPGVSNSQQKAFRSEKLRDFKRSDAIKNLFTAFADLQKGAVLRVLSIEDEKERNATAERITKRISALLVKSSGDKCPPGTKPNPLTGDCEST